ncbi:MAG: tandem-95 repeat protein, partial [Caldilineae bacterium]
ANDTDPDGSLNATSVTTTTSPLNGAVTIDPVTGVITYTPNSNFLGNDLFTYRVCDNDALCDTAQVNLTVYAVPTAADDTAYTQKDVAVTIDVLLNDSDFDGYLVPSTVVTTTNPGHGSVNINTSNGEITYTPATGWTGTDSFIYQVCDNDSHCDTATVTVIVTTLIPPVAVDDHSATPVNTSITVQPLANDTDADGTIVVSSLVTVTNPADGVITIDSVTGSVTYTPTASFYGNDSFGYQVCDNDNLCDIGVVTISVLDPPVANDDSVNLGKNTSLPVDVLANDTDADSALDATSVVTTSSPIHGNIVIDPVSGVITYTAVTDYVGTDGFGYRVCDVDG